MSDFRFVHAADIHLDSPLLGLESHEDAPSDLIRGATREALAKLVDLCISEQVAFLIIAGDVYDGDWRSAETGRFFARQMLKLANAEPPIPVFLIKGNHDAASIISREMAVPSVYTFPHNKAGTVRLNDYQVAIHGRSYSRPDLSEDISLEYPAPVAGMFNIGMLHTCATGRDGHQRYAPCDPNRLAQKGYDYWALGHIHTRETLHEKPYVVFPGNIQGRHIRETAIDGKGCTLVSVSAGEVIELRHVPLDVVRWDFIEVDISESTTEAEAIDLLIAEISARARSIEGRLLAARIRIVGSTPVSLDIHRDIARFVGSLRERASAIADDVWLEDVVLDTRTPRLEEDMESGGSILGLIESIREYADQNLDALYQERVLPVVNRIRASAPEMLTELGIDQPDLTAKLLPDIEQAILAIAEKERGQ